MRFQLENDIGGFLWWLLIKFCKTNLKEEQSKEKWSRNIFFLIVIGTTLGFISVKFF
jgi:hypothetical protein